MTEDTYASIASQVLFDEHPDIDGVTNSQRAVYVCRGLEVESLDLSQEMNLDQLELEEELPMIEAAENFLTLQFTYYRRLLDSGFLAEEEFLPKRNSLSMDIRRLRWHKKHLKKGVPTPPFSCIL